ncbi:MAG: hypothetical protein GY924_14745 [Planctomycetaceae bacterium]|nr:hypothetical protein [Planctomycetaceae bacterium]
MERVGRMEAEHMVRLGEVLGTTGSNVADRISESGLLAVQLFVSQSSIAALESELPDSGFKYKDASLVYRGGFHEVDVRFRGDSAYHWGYWKKSWRVKTSRDLLFDGMRKFNLVAPRTPEMLNNHLGHRLASTMGLIAPKSEVVPLILNADFHGIYILTEQLEESTVRRAGKMPGDLYSGDLAVRESFSGILPMLFEHPRTWEKVAINNHFEDEALDPLERLVTVLAGIDSEENQAELSRLLDLEAFAKFSAFEALAGTVHYDISHNWRLYYDPWRNQIVPVVWDSVAWTRGWRHKPGQRFRSDVISSPLHLALFQNAEFLRLRERAFRQFFADGTADRFLAEVSQVVGSVHSLVDIDPDIVYRLDVLSASEVHEALDDLQAHIQFVFRKQKAVHLGGAQSRVDYAAIGHDSWAVKVSGRQQVEKLTWGFLEPAEGRLSCSVEWTTAEGSHSADLTGALSVSGSRVHLDVGLIGNVVIVAPSMRGRDVKYNYLKHEPGYYEITIEGLPDSSVLLDLTASFVGGKQRSASVRKKIPVKEMGATAQLVNEARVTAPTVWSDSLLIEGELFLQDLVIEPGTVVRMGPAASVIVEGRVRANGTKAKPISFVAAQPEMGPWAMIAIRGRGADGSVFRNCSFRGGSGQKKPLAEYSAMMSIHDVMDVRFESCTFSDSQVVDDMVHGVYSEIVFLNCVFVNARSDALDMDISSLVLDGCTFESSGNDSLDLMTTEAVVMDCRFLNSGDKGVSVGERSSMLLMQSEMKDCVIGVEIKDESVALLCNVDLLDNQIGVNAYKKNWRYDGGGHGAVLNTRFVGNVEDFAADRHSSLFVNRSTWDTRLAFEASPEIILGKNLAVSDEEDRQGAPLGRIRMEGWLEQVGLNTPFFSKYIGRINSKILGRAR